MRSSRTGDNGVQVIIGAPVRRDNFKEKALLGGVDVGSAMHQLKKSLMFSMAQKLGMDTCFRCKEPIETPADLSVDHKEPWRIAVDPIAAFYDLSEIAFSHRGCNSAAARQINRKYESREAQEFAKNKRNQPRRLAKRKLWRQRRREEGLPYT